MWLQGPGSGGAGGAGDMRDERFSARAGGSGAMYVSALRGVHSLDFNFPRASTMERSGAHFRGASMGTFLEGGEEGRGAAGGAAQDDDLGGGLRGQWSEGRRRIQEGLEERIRDSALSRRPSRLRTLSRTVKQMSSRQVDLDSGGLAVRHQR